MQQSTALKILQTGANVFLTGEPGSGKTYVVNAYVAWLRDKGINVAITASTGIAATHIGGMTIHSWAGIGVKKYLSAYEVDAIVSNERIAKRIRATRVLIIDEISMLAADTLTMVDTVVREVLQKNEPFGGIQVVFVGDFFQLPPIVSRTSYDDEPVVRLGFGEDTVGAPFAFRSSAWIEANPIMCYLSEQHRQDDVSFVRLLGQIRAGSVHREMETILLARKTPEEKAPKDLPRLYSHNVDVDRVNEDRLAGIKGDLKTYRMRAQGAPPLIASLQRGCLSPQDLKLKKGARVMFTKNNPDGSFVNGTLGEVEGFTTAGDPIVCTFDNERITVQPMDWMINDGDRVLAQISQLPLRLAWAVTIHKSQGMTLDAAVIDLSQAFEYGQGYVALSRVRSLDGLHLLGLNERALEVHPEVIEQDRKFQARSREAKEAFEEMTDDDHKKIASNFIVYAGGRPEGGVVQQSAKTSVKVSTKSQTGALIKDGKTISAIARIRNLKEGTIISHVLELYGEGEITRDELERSISPTLNKALPVIHMALKKKGADTLTPAFKHLKGKYSFDDLRLARLLM